MQICPEGENLIHPLDAPAMVLSPPKNHGAFINALITCANHCS